VKVAQSAMRIRRGGAAQFDLPDGPRRVAQLPVLFYPHLLEVCVDGRRTDRFGHVDGHLAVDLPPGPHQLTAQVAGAEWTNWLSGIAWLGVACAAVVALRRTFATVWSGPRTSTPSAFPLPAAAFGFVLLIVPMTLPAAFVHWKRDEARRAMGLALPSSEGFPAAKVMSAFDGDPETAWVTIPGPSAWLVLLPREKRTISSIELEPRQTEVLLGWHRVRVILYLKDRTVADQTFDLPDAARQPVQVLKLSQPAEADGIELRFAQPVTLTRTGDRHIPLEACYCGYREIRIR
jgi:hypothetical protein